MAGPIRVWDVPTRLFHWVLVALLLFSWWSAKNHHMEWHLKSGICLLGLMLFRLLWGFFGSSTARFLSFLYSPAQVIAYLRSGAAPRSPGHNPIGGYSVLVMLLALCAQIGSGLFATDIDGLESGPLSYLVDFDQSRVAAKIHGISFNILLALGGLHILAILFYLVARKRDLIRPMITGSDAHPDAGTESLASAGIIRLALAVAVAAAIAWWVGSLGG